MESVKSVILSFVFAGCRIPQVNMSDTFLL